MTVCAVMMQLKSQVTAVGMAGNCLVLETEFLCKLHHKTRAPVHDYSSDYTLVNCYAKKWLLKYSEYETNFNTQLEEK